MRLAWQQPATRESVYRRHWQKGHTFPPFGEWLFGPEGEKPAPAPCDMPYKRREYWEARVEAEATEETRTL